MANFCTRADRVGTVIRALTLVGLAAAPALFMTASASAMAQEFVPMTTFNARRLRFRKPLHRRRKHGVECELGGGGASKSGIG